MNKFNLNQYLDETEIKEYKSWDYNLNYNQTYKSLVSCISEVRKDLKSGNITINRIRKFTNLISGLIQLRNGGRVGEMLKSLNEFCTLKKRVVQVKVQKRKDEYYRKVVLPDEITIDDLTYIESYVHERIQNKELFVQALSKFFKKHFGFSTHALRYCWISFISSMNVPAQVIAKITGHKTLDLILHYTQRKLGDKILFNMSTS